MKNTIKIYIFLILAALRAFAIFNNYETALEIKRVNSQDFNGFALEYNHNPYNQSGWSQVSSKSNDSEGSNLYLYSDFNNKKDKNFYFRLINMSDEKVSDIHFTNIKRLRTNFIKQAIIDGVAGNTVVTDEFKTQVCFNYFQTNFKLKDFGSDAPKLRLYHPSPNEVIRNQSVHFSWAPISSNRNTINVLSLEISDHSYNVCQSIVLNDATNYTWSVPGSYENGVYYWQIKLSSNTGEIYGSEVRPFIITDDVTDTDGDGYLDVEELARGSDPNDPNDIPLIITSPSECQQAYKELQYFNVLKANKSDRLEWQLIGRLPEGLRLSTGGALQGRPQNTGDYIFAVCVYDQKGKTDEKTFHLEILKPAPSSVRMGLGGFR